ncbi:MAG: GNAT family N-acetyltransferase [Kofleriaceae bacterium]
MAARHFTPEYLERAELRDGTWVRLRLVRPEDKAILRAGFASFSAESRYARFLGPKSALSDDELRYLTEVDHEDHLALGATRDDEHGQPIGLAIARFIKLPDRHAMAEAAIAVADEAQQRGLGKLMFLRLCAAAAERGIERFHCELLGSNTGMQKLLEHVAPDRTMESAGGVTTIELVLPEVTPTDPPTRSAPDNAMYRLFRAAAENAVDWTEAVRNLWRR